jgi:hemolysin III
MSEASTPKQTVGEEIANAVTHGAGLALSIAGLVLMVWKAASAGDAWHIVSASVFGATLIIMYLASTLYHGVQHEKAKRALRLFDHSAIFLLIAGTYTPFTLVTLRGGVGWTLFGVVWGLGLAGIIYKLVARGDYKRQWISVSLYVGMGWAAIFAIKPLFDALPAAGLAWMIGGGVAYTGGVLFYALDHKRWFHPVWHLFVLAGSICHFFAVFGYVLP